MLRKLFFKSSLFSMCTKFGHKNHVDCMSSPDLVPQRIFDFSIDFISLDSVDHFRHQVCSIWAFFHRDIVRRKLRFFSCFWKKCSARGHFWMGSIQEDAQAVIFTESSQIFAWTSMRFISCYHSLEFLAKQPEVDQKLISILSHFRSLPLYVLKNLTFSSSPSQFQLADLFILKKKVKRCVTFPLFILCSFASNRMNKEIKSGKVTHLFTFFFQINKSASRNNEGVIVILFYTTMCPYRYYRSLAL